MYRPRERRLFVGSTDVSNFEVLLKSSLVPEKSVSATATFTRSSVANAFDFSQLSVAGATPIIFNNIIDSPRFVNATYTPGTGTNPFGICISADGASVYVDRKSVV